MFIQTVPLMLSMPYKECLTAACSCALTVNQRCWDDNSKTAPTGWIGFQPFLQDNEQAVAALVLINTDSLTEWVESLYCRLPFHFTIPHSLEGKIENLCVCVWRWGRGLLTRAKFLYEWIVWVSQHQEYCADLCRLSSVKKIVIWMDFLL